MREWREPRARRISQARSTAARVHSELSGIESCDARAAKSVSLNLPVLSEFDKSGWGHVEALAEQRRLMVADFPLSAQNLEGVALSAQ
jgi:hypothetical protein